MSSYVDFHLHISINPLTAFLYPEFTFSKYLLDKQQTPIQKSVCFINPFVRDILCRNNPKHKIRIEDSTTAGELRIVCTECKTTLYEGIDPLRKYNEALLIECRKHENMFPFVYLNICCSNIVQEISYFEQKYDNVMGYKLHPTLSNRSILDLGEIPTSKPILVHTGVEECAKPQNVVQFAKKHCGSVIMAHLARFNQEALEAVHSIENLYVDTSPMGFLHQLVIKKPHRVYPTNWFTSQVNDIHAFYCDLFNYMPPQKVLFATDAPFSSLVDEVALFDSIFPNATEIAKENAEKILFNERSCS